MIEHVQHNCAGVPLPMAHVSYVVDPAKMEALAGEDWGFLLSPLTDPFYLFLIVATVILVAAIFLVAQTIGPIRRYCHKFHDRCLSYHRYIPLVLRMGLGVTLIVSGTKQSIFLPHVPGPALTNVMVVLGFFMLTGFLVRLCGIFALIIFIYGLTVSPYLFGTLESAAAAILVTAYGSDRPSIDHLFEIENLGSSLEPLWKIIREATGPIIRVLMGLTLIWLAITEKALNPRVTEAVIIDFNLPAAIPVSTAMWVFAVGVIELAVGLVLVLGFFTRSFAIIAFIVLTISFLYFREEVVGHITFFASLLVLIITGAGRCSVDSTISWTVRRIRGTSTAYEQLPTT